MQIMFALAERRGYPVGENWPELIAAVDEGTDGDNPAYYPAQVELARGSWGTEMGDVRHFVVDLPDVDGLAVVVVERVDAPLGRRPHPALSVLLPEHRLQLGSEFLNVSRWQIALLRCPARRGMRGLALARHSRPAAP